MRHAPPDVPTVLLVAPVQDDRMMYADYLRYCGLNPIEIGDTAEALSRAHQADVIVTGIRVDGPFDGVELVRRLREGDGTHDTPIIVLTASAVEPNPQRALAAGCDLFLEKPCLPDRLLREILAILTGRTPKAKPAPASANHRHVQPKWVEKGVHTFRRGGSDGDSDVPSET